MNDVREALRLNLIRYLDIRKMSQKQLAEKLGVTQSAVSNWAKGNNSPNIEIVAQISGILDVSVEDLLTEPEQKEKAPVLQESPEETEARAIMLYKALINGGWIKEGQDITDQQLEVLDGISIILSSLFD